VSDESPECGTPMKYYLVPLNIYLYIMMNGCDTIIPATGWVKYIQGFMHSSEKENYFFKF